MTGFRREPVHRYSDPLDEIWLRCAERVGFRVERSAEVYASYDGAGTLLIGDDVLLDPDDCLAQMIFHECCHALIEGDAGLSRVDFGLDNTSGRDTWHEHACLRLQAHLAGRVGLRDFFAPTTDFRVTFWPSLGVDPFAAPAERGGRRERSCVAARLGAWRAAQQPWAPHLLQALVATAVIARMVCADLPSAATSPESVGTGEAGPEKGLRSLWSVVGAEPPMHPAGHAPIAVCADNRCTACAWHFRRRGRVHCRHAPAVALTSDTSACDRFEPVAELNCASCGACCREAYHRVEVAADDPVIARQPEWIEWRGEIATIRRDGDRCAALAGGDPALDDYHCRIYRQRPRTCREFELGSEHCLDARRRVGLSL